MCLWELYTSADLERRGVVNFKDPDMVAVTAALQVVLISHQSHLHPPSGDKKLLLTLEAASPNQPFRALEHQLVRAEKGTVHILCA